MQEQNPETNESLLSRRRFLGVAAAAAGGSTLRPLQQASGADTLRIPVGTPPSRVVRVLNPKVVSETNVHQHLLVEMLQQALTALTETNSIKEAWRKILRPDDVVGLKFNQSGQRVIATTEPLADALVASIVDAGWPPDRIVCIEVARGTGLRERTTPARAGYQARITDFGSGKNQFASVLSQVTALIDVPFLKSHNIAGMTCALKNLSHGLIKHPSRYHSNGCSPYIADIVACPLIRDKLRLCLVDALRVVYDGGPEPTAGTISNQGTLLTSFDPVAVDTVSLAILNEIRRRYKLSPIARSAENIGYLAAAHRRGLGIAMWHGIDLVDLRP